MVEDLWQDLKIDIHKSSSSSLTDLELFWKRRIGEYTRFCKYKTSVYDVLNRGDRIQKHATLFVKIFENPCITFLPLGECGPVCFSSIKHIEICERHCTLLFAVGLEMFSTA